MGDQQPVTTAYMTYFHSTLSNNTQTTFREELADANATAGGPWLNYGEYDGMLGLLQAPEETQIESLRSELISMYCTFLSNNAEYLPSTWNWDDQNVRAVVRRSSVTALKAMKNSLPKKPPSSGSYPEELYFLFVTICTAFQLPWSPQMKKKRESY